MDTVPIPAGVQVYFGAPANPMHERLVGVIAELVNMKSEIVEAHLPQCYIPASMQQPAQVLVVVLAAEARVENTLKSLQEGVRFLTLPDGHLDIWPLSPNDDLLPAIRKAGCSLKSASSMGSEVEPQPRRWWQIWSKSR